MTVKFAGTWHKTKDGGLAKCMTEEGRPCSKHADGEHITADDLESAYESMYANSSDDQGLSENHAESLKRRMASMHENARGAVGDIKDIMNDGIDSLMDKATTMRDDAVAKVAETRDAAVERANALRDKAVLAKDGVIHGMTAFKEYISSFAARMFPGIHGIGADMAARQAQADEEMTDKERMAAQASHPMRVARSHDHVPSGFDDYDDYTDSFNNAAARSFINDDTVMYGSASMMPPSFQPGDEFVGTSPVTASAQPMRATGTGTCVINARRGLAGILHGGGSFTMAGGTKYRILAVSERKIIGADGSITTEPIFVMEARSSVSMRNRAAGLLGRMASRLSGDPVAPRQHATSSVFAV